MWIYIIPLFPMLLYCLSEIEGQSVLPSGRLLVLDALICPVSTVVAFRPGDSNELSDEKSCNITMFFFCFY